MLTLTTKAQLRSDTTYNSLKISSLDLDVDYPQKIKKGRKGKLAMYYYVWDNFKVYAVLSAINVDTGDSEDSEDDELILHAYKSKIRLLDAGLGVTWKIHIFKPKQI